MIRMKLLAQPLLRLLLINLGIGVSVALLMLGGLLALDAGGLRQLILADRSPATAIALLGFGLVITFGSVAMGTAIMALGGDDRRRDRQGGKPVAIPIPIEPARDLRT
ncbi:MAG: hypothetical protein IT538_02975 [Variibacter sp.]|nr:hypothetical protein [Variibacter sp.]